MLGFKITTTGTDGQKPVNLEGGGWSEGSNSLEILAKAAKATLNKGGLLSHVPEAVSSALETLYKVEMDRVGDKIALQSQGVTVSLQTDQAKNDTFQNLGPFTLHGRDDLKNLMASLGAMGHGKEVLSTLVHQLNEALPYDALNHLNPTGPNLQIKIDT